MKDALVTVQSLTRDFDVSKPWLNRVLTGASKKTLTAVDSVNFTIERGSTYALVGESGSGKSTIAKIHIDGVDLFTASASDIARTRQRIQMIFQDPYASLNPRWRVRDIVGEPIDAFQNLSNAERTRKVHELLEKVGLSTKDGAKFPHEFSGGQRQRIGIARALASDPEFIVCDEPTSALDVSVQAQVLNLMRDLQRDLGLTYLFITHDLAVVQYMADHVGVLYLGRLIESAPRRMLFDNPAHPYTQMLIDAAPKVDGFGREHEAIDGEIPDPISPPSGCYFHPRCPKKSAHCSVEVPVVIHDGNGRSVSCLLHDENSGL